MTLTPAPLWILAVPARTLAEAEALAERLSDLCDTSPVELEAPGQSVIWLEVYFDEELPARITADVLRREFKDVELSVRPCPQQDWTTFWRHHFHPRDIGKNLRIVPEWLRNEVPPAPGRQTVLVNPGLSFGTGDHFTTRYCLTMIESLAATGLKPARCFDAGCGSAILSITTKKLGWPSILAVDHDPVAVAQAAENLELNDITDGIELKVMDLTREWPQERFPLVIANLYGGLLMELAPQLLRVCSGTLVLSGIRAVESEAVAAVFAQLGAREISSDADHEWCGFRFEVE